MPKVRKEISELEKLVQFTLDDGTGTDRLTRIFLIIMFICITPFNH